MTEINKYMACGVARTEVKKGLYRVSALAIEGGALNNGDLRKVNIEFTSEEIPWLKYDNWVVMTPKNIKKLKDKINDFFSEKEVKQMLKL